jgi:hypothetical protein
MLKILSTILNRGHRELLAASINFNFRTVYTQMAPTPYTRYHIITDCKNNDKSWHNLTARIIHQKISISVSEYQLIIKSVLKRNEERTADVGKGVQQQSGWTRGIIQLNKKNIYINNNNITITMVKAPTCIALLIWLLNQYWNASPIAKAIHRR